MKTIFETCEPRPEVLRGELKDEIFAARLMDVVNRKAEDVYQDPAVFFDNTFPTEGLRLLADEGLGRLSGKKPGNSPIIRLETAFGGGKTHSLIALYHLGQAVVTPEMARDIVDPSLLLSEPIATAAIVGTHLDPNGVTHGDITAHTMWGEIAFRIGGPAGFRMFEESDRSRVAPGGGALDDLIGDSPALIIIDELPRYLRAAKGVQVGDTTLAGQTIAFFLSLLEFVASKARVVVAYSLAEGADAFGEESDATRQELGEASRISARDERIITPTDETEISAIVNHRLFRTVDQQAAEETATSYSRYYSQIASQAVDLPNRAHTADYRKEISASYPFHPELLTTLNRKTATIHNFQRTRGALRLLALVVRQLWAKKPGDAFLIHPWHLDLSNSGIANDLTSRLERPRFRSVIEADIVSPLAGSKAHAQEIDSAWVEAGRPGYAQRLATTIFLHSIVQDVASGVEPADLLLAVVEPEDDPGLVDRGLKRLLGDDRDFSSAGTACWHLEWDGQRYRFKMEPSLHKIVADEMEHVGRVKAKEEMDQRIRQIWRGGVLEPKYFPDEAADVDDDAGKPKLAVIHYDAASVEAADSAPPDLVRKLFDYSGTLEGYRTYKNNVLFLVADRDQTGRLVEVAQRYLALRRITSSGDRMGEFTKEQQKTLRSMREAAELDVRVAVTRAYRFLYYPSADAPKRASNLAIETLPPQDQGEVDKDQSAVLVRTLRNLSKVLTAEDPPLAAAFVRSKAWPQNQTSISTEDLRRAFAQRMGLRMLLDVNQLKKTIRDGVQNGTWVYYDTVEKTGYGRTSPVPLVRIGEDAQLYTPEEADRVGIAIKGEEKGACPVCGRTEDECICGEVCPDCGSAPCVCTKEGAVRLHAEGAPAQAFQQILDQCHDHGVAAIAQLVVSVEGQGKDGAHDARALGLAIPQLGKGKYHIDQTMGAEFGAAETFSLTFAGGWDRYKRVKQLTDAFAQEAAKLTTRLKLRADFPDGLPVASDQFQIMRDVFASLELGHMVLYAEPVREEAGT